MKALDVLKNFTKDELACPLTGGMRFHDGFPEALQLLRDTIGAPIYVSSCCRSMAYNNTLTLASVRSLHVYDYPDTERGHKGTLAIDIRVVDHVYRHELIKCATMLGWSGYVIPGGNVHLDRRDLIGEPTIWWHYR